jgi:hypothetical protein
MRLSVAYRLWPRVSQRSPPNMVTLGCLTKTKDVQPRGIAGLRTLNAASGPGRRDGGSSPIWRQKA